MRVQVLGGGIMGAQIACEYALAGHDVALLTRSRRSASPRIDAAFMLVEEEGLGSARSIASARRSLRFVDDSSEPCDLAVESLPEDFDVKTRVLRDVATRSPDACIATNTSSLSVAKLAHRSGAVGRMVGTHYWNPPLLMPLVEVVVPPETTPDRLDFIWSTLIRSGKEPVLVQDVPGFVWNRLQAAVLREAVWLVENGVASAEDVDRIVRTGLARRWRHIGPFETVVLGGAETWDEIMRNLLPHLSRARGLAPLGPLTGGTRRRMAELRRRRDAGLATELRQSESPKSRDSQDQ